MFAHIATIVSRKLAVVAMKLTGCRSFATEQADSLAQRLLAEFPSSRFASVLWGRKILTHGNPAPFPLFVYKIKWRDKKGALTPRSCYFILV